MKKDKTIKINNEEEVTYYKGKYTYRGKSYKIREWYSLCASFRVFNEEEIELRYLPSNISPSYLKETYIKNVKMATFYCVIAPLIFFFLVGIFFHFIFSNATGSNPFFISRSSAASYICRFAGTGIRYSAG